jgi:hypothetical protein
MTPEWEFRLMTRYKEAERARAGGDPGRAARLMADFDGGFLETARELAKDEVFRSREIFRLLRALEEPDPAVLTEGRRAYLLDRVETLEDRTPLWARCSEEEVGR